jgi:hypothetical protein
MMDLFDIGFRVGPCVANKYRPFSYNCHCLAINIRYSGIFFALSFALFGYLWSFAPNVWPFGPLWSFAPKCEALLLGWLEQSSQRKKDGLGPKGWLAGLWLLAPY